MDPLNALLDSLNEVGSRVRYGVSPTEKYQMMMSGSVPGQPKPFLPGGDENPEAVRYLSNYLGAKQWGQAPAHAVNLGRYLLDNDTAAYASGVKGEQMAGGNPLQALLMSLGKGWTVNLYDSVNNVLKRLDDYPAVGGEREWPREEIELYVKDGYNQFCRRTRAVFDMFYPENVAAIGNYVGKWEENYFEPGMIAQGLLNFTGGYWEQDYGQAGAIGPITSTQPWEEEYLEDLETLLVVSRGAVPEDNVTIDRATHDYIEIDPEYTRRFEEHERNFQTVSGDPTRFSHDRDGIGTMRLVPAGAGDATEVEVDGPYNPLKAYWTLDEVSGTRYDSVASYDLSVVNAPGSTTGQINNSATFLNTSLQYLTRTSHVPLDASLGVTVAGWINVRSGAPTLGIYFLNGKIPNPTKGYVALHTAAAGPLWVFVEFYNSVGANAIAGVLLPSYDTWHYIAGRYDPDTRVASISIDGGTFASGSTMAAGTHPDVGAGSVFLGGGIVPSFATGYSRSYMDEVGLWNTALTLDEVAELYNLTRPEFKKRNSGFGLLRSAEDEDGLGTWDPDGAWGGLREIPEHFRMGGQYGVPRRLFSDVGNSRAEYFRLGSLEGQRIFDLPDRFIHSVEYYAVSKALERDGPGQDLGLAGHFMQRFEDGVSRMILRLGENRRPRVAAIGSGGKGAARPVLARLPYQYGRQIRRGY